MTKSKVALVRCESYDEAEVSAAVSRGAWLLGGISGFVKPGERITMKPNLLIASGPEKSVTTHPAVFKAVGLLLQQTGARVFYGDSPSIGACELNFKLSGLKQIGDELGFTLADFDHGREVLHKTARLNMKFVIANGALDSDGMVSLPKFKTHGLTRFTGAVKNQFGCVPGILKGQFHAKMADPYEFAAMLVDLNTYLRPRLYIMDGISAMEGNGPRNGKPRQMNVLLFSSDPIALDAAACRMIDLNPEFVPTSTAGEKAGLGTYHSENIELLGDDIESFTVKDFDVVKAPPERIVPGRVFAFIRNRITPRPAIDSVKCTACGTCIEMCPIGPTALDWTLAEAGRVPKHNYDKCIRCYCCQETCPEGAITIQNPPLSKLLFRA
ncbi:MAG TPA: DUF362 domain-containing protein [Dehalococcoidales bacterium]|nr:DUF362 domain-containing protein [Dehalococcoidales bacterium]